MRYMSFFVVFILGLFLASCSQQEQPSSNQPAPSLGMPAPGANPDDVQEMIVVEEPGGAVKSFDLVAKQFEFIPNVIEVNQGDIVKVTLTSADVVHGFAINEYGVNERVVPGQPTTVEFTADRKGTFTFYCSVSCGSGPGRVKGTFIVK